MANKQPEVTDATREAFVEAFFRLADIKPLYSITVRELTGLAGYNRTTFYRYFADVFALIEHVEDEFIDGVLDSAAPMLESGARPDDAFFAVYLEAFKKHRDRLSVLLCDQNRSAFVRRIQERTLSAASVPIADTPANKVVMGMYLTAIFTVMASHIQNPSALSDEELLGIVRRLFEKWYWPEVSGAE